MASIDINENKADTYNYSLIIKNRYFNDKRSRMEKEAIRAFMLILKHMIQARTNLCYLANFNDKDSSILIPVDVLDNTDVDVFHKLIKKKLLTLKKYLEDEIDYEKLNDDFKVIVSALSLYKFDYSRMLYISSSSFKNRIDINLRVPTLKKMIIRRHQFGEDTFVEVINPYISQSLMDFDFSVPYSEMSILYNALHVYEHIMCIPWGEIDPIKNERLRYMNGFTASIGLCHVFALCENYDTFEKYLKTECNWLLASREEQFWTKNKKSIQMQITRTISETRNEPQFVSFARSPGCAYEFDYNIKLFRYWSNRPINCLLVHPYEQFDISKLALNVMTSRHPVKNIRCPESPKFNYYPFSALAVPGMRSTTEKKDAKQMTNLLNDYFIHGIVPDGAPGVDVVRRDLTMQYEFFKDNYFSYIPMCIVTQCNRMLTENVSRQVIVFMFAHTYGDLQLWTEENSDSQEHSMKADARNEYQMFGMKNEAIDEL